MPGGIRSGWGQGTGVAPIKREVTVGLYIGVGPTERLIGPETQTNKTADKSAAGCLFNSLPRVLAKIATRFLRPLEL